MQTQTVVITGASAGIGRATARLSGARGARVGLIARGQAGLDGAARDVKEAGGTALAISVDFPTTTRSLRPPGRSSRNWGRLTCG